MLNNTLSKLLVAFSLLLAISSCKKDDASPSGPSSTTCNEIPYKVGSVATYSKAGGGSFTITFTTESTINGNKYIKGESSLGTSGTGYIRVDTSGNVWQYIPSQPGLDIPASEMIVVKTGKPVGESWSYTYPSISDPTSMSYKFTYTVMANNISFTMNGNTYSNCMKVQTETDIIYMGVPMGTSAFTASTWGCGIGIIGSEANGSPYSTLTNYVY